VFDWLTTDNVKAFVGPAATVIASFAAICFARAQLQVARAQKDIAYDKLKLDLFERRYAIYAAAKDVIMYIREGKGGRIEDANFMREHYIALDEARFFFDPEIQALLANVKEQCEGCLEADQDMMNPEMNPEDDTVAWDEKTRQAAHRLRKLSEMYADLPRRFEKTLEFTSVKSPRR
jgi:hypothetical protein